ncbi:hypothetical protein FOZ60_010534 [Perkinsus olseni]|uniref:Uncharacterized protein n=1 Tax=Perkinsus olseni TaxID=32597 RepID=A0A7J6PBT3_PEROL|nr:hypothetical protein FOZ60_010534 [Perkinsus olseni]
MAFMLGADITIRTSVSRLAPYLTFFNLRYFPRFTRLPNNWRGKLLREGADNAEWRGRSLFRDTMASRRCESPVPCRSTGDGDQGFDLTRGMWCCSLPQSPSLLRSRSSPHFPAHHDEVD